MNDYERIARAIEFIHREIRQQPTLEQIAAQVNLSSSHFQRLFSRWAGISPKRYLQHVTETQARNLLDRSRSVLETSQELGLSSTARLHDHFVSLSAITPGQYQSRGEGLEIRYGTHDTPFGRAFIALTDRGICQLGFFDDDGSHALHELMQRWPRARLSESTDATSHTVSRLFDMQTDQQEPLSIFIKGTNFQISVWRALLQIPYGQTASYGQLAHTIQQPKAARAVGSAVAANPVAWLIPCHRVIRSSGAIGDYRWGQTRKRLLLTYESLSRIKQDS
ncbi:MAG: methylated-DNA--[protein]-cysteine S-methyltransferase [Thiotrichales bacterium]|nr:methylated-DNA--[protein]-cysteine S-methyltransferase [Thiotrichales bacterium]